ncbi:MAG: hypothetical protein COA43_04645 [Robiginitomaculum sp.]|nr:MAG: hypothetical protein COA43_04645 [Robiginitomaculum sp.]
MTTIISAHPSDGKGGNTEKRFRAALTALTGTALTKQTSDDYDSLMRMAWLYHSEKVEGMETPVLNHLAKRAYVGSPKDRNIEESSLIKKLTRDFKKSKNILLARITSQDDWDRMDEIKNFKRLLSNLQKAGVPNNPTAISPKIVSRNFSKGS